MIDMMIPTTTHIFPSKGWDSLAALVDTPDVVALSLVPRVVPLYPVVEYLLLSALLVPRPRPRRVGIKASQQAQRTTT